MTDSLCGSVFSIAPQAFYQVNPPQAERLYSRAVELALPELGGTVFELYCGAGTISLSLARRAGRVVGAEIVPEAVGKRARKRPPQRRGERRIHLRRRGRGRGALPRERREPGRHSRRPAAQGHERRRRARVRRDVPRAHSLRVLRSRHPGP